MGTSYTPIFLFENGVYKVTNSRLQSVKNSNVWTDEAVWTSSWSSDHDDNKLVEFFRIPMLLTPLRLV